MLITDAVRACLEQAGCRPRDRVLVAFSGGCDSTALLVALAELAPALGIEVVAAHLDHGLDAESARRAQAALRAAEALGVRCLVERRVVPPRVAGGRGIEAQARGARYAFLEEVQQQTGARWIATAHHRGDQAETVLLRLLFGSSLAGLRGIRPFQAALIRPLLHTTRLDLETFLEDRAIDWLEDPTNRELGRPRNRIRHSLLPALAADIPHLEQRLADLAGNVDSLAGVLGRRLERQLDIRAHSQSASLDLPTFLALPEALRPWALASLHRAVGSAYPAGEAAQRELVRQLAAGDRIGCDSGAGWRWNVSDNRLFASASRAEAPDFSYTLAVPGRLTLGELGLEIGLETCAPAPWMLRPSNDRAALALSVEPGERVTIRNRRSGDRIQPLGWDRCCRVKNLLINRQVPKEERSRLPLICHNDAIAWIPGVTIDERFRISAGKPVWVATLRIMRDDEVKQL